MNDLDHKHEWQPIGMSTEREYQVRYLGTTLPSYRDNSIAVQSCKCGEIKKIIVSYGVWDH